MESFKACSLNDPGPRGADRLREMGAATQAEEGNGLPGRLGIVALMLLPAALTLYFAFNSGGLFEVTTAFGAAAVLVVAAAVVALSPRPLRALGPWGASACGLLGCYALWTVLSARWSHSTGRSLVAFDRVLLYLAILALFACIPRTEARVRWLLRGLLAAASTVAVVALVSRLMPSWWPTTAGLVDDRLSYPLTYWNALGLLVGMGCVLAVHHTSDDREPRGVRILAAALLPPLSATLLLTFSRGAIGVTVVGIAVYLIAARPFGFVGGFLAAAAPTAIALARTYSADLIHEGTPLTPAALAQGKSLGLTLLACAAGAALLRALTLRLDDRVATLFTSSPDLRRRARLVGLGAAATLLVVFVVAGGPAAIDRQYHHFVDNTQEASTADSGQRSRLLEIGNDGRLPMWEVARDAYRAEPLKGTGAGTFQLRWERDRGGGPLRLYAYSLYVESLGELGLVGIVLLGAAVLALLAGLAWRLREPDRPIYAAGFALALAWALHAGIDIDWQNPAVCVPVFAVAGLAMARHRASLRAGPEPALPPAAPALASAAYLVPRPALALACVALAIVPARMALAQSDGRDAVRALSAGDCREATARAHDSIGEIDAGPRPYEVLAMCAARGGDGISAVRWARRAVAADPSSWEPHFTLALAQAYAGGDPRREAGIALRADPLLAAPREAVAAFSAAAPNRWRQAALSLPFAIE
jgi:O-Antigen ligase